MLWEAVDRLVDGPHDVEALRAHGIQLLAARRWRVTGRFIPEELLADEREAVMVALMAPALLDRVRTIIPGPLVLLKGAEVAAYYPDPGLRPFGDLDILVLDATSAQETLLRAGFVLAEKHDHRHHRAAIRWPGSALLVEIHDAPPWLPWMTPPSVDELVAATVPSAVGIDGVLALPQSYQALLLAAHSWRSAPLRRLLDLIDVAVMSDGVNRSELDALARCWRVERVWQATMWAIDAFLLGDERPSWTLHLLASHCRSFRERTLVEEWAARWVGAGWAPSAAEGLAALINVVKMDIGPQPGQSWAGKLSGLPGVTRDAFRPASTHIPRTESESLSALPTPRLHNSDRVR